MDSPLENYHYHLLETPLWFERLHAVGGRLLQVPGLQALRPLAQKVKAVAEPVRRLSFQTHPPATVSHSTETVTILSANLWHDWPRFRDQQTRLERLAQLAEKERADILLLQEVSRTPRLQVDHWLGQRLGMASVYSRANGHAAAIGFEEGVAILSRFPLSTLSLRQLGSGKNPFVRRLALSADVTTPGGRLALFSVHLGLLPHQNAHQLTHLLSWVSTLAHDRPALIGGDFNAHENSPQIRQAQQTWLDTFRHRHPHAEGTTHEWGGWGRLPLRRRRLDYIFFQPHLTHWQVAETGHLDAPDGPHSDHRAVLLRLQSG